MSDFGINGNHIESQNSTITLGRNSMKQQITSIAVAGIAAVIIAGAGIIAGVSDHVVRADEPAKAKVVNVYANTSPDLPELDNNSPAKTVRNRAVAGGSPDLPEMDAYSPVTLKVRPLVGGPFANTSPDLPELDAKVNTRMRVGADPEENPEFFYRSAKMQPVIGGSFANTSPDLPELGAKVNTRIRVGADPEENPEYFYRSAKVRPVIGGNFANTSPDLPELGAKVTQAHPNESFAYWSIDGINSVLHNPPKATVRTHDGGSPDLPELPYLDSKSSIRTYVGTSPDLPDTI